MKSNGANSLTVVVLKLEAVNEKETDLIFEESNIRWRLKYILSYDGDLLQIYIAEDRKKAQSNIAAVN
jgi:hypothetical protein